MKVVGAGFFAYDLTSECKCNRKVRIRGLVSSLGMGISFKFSGTGSSVTFNDHYDCPQHDVANGGFAMASISSVFGVGFSCSKVALGGLYTDFTCSSGPVFGLDFGVGLFEGASMVTEVEEVSCCE